jgi:hypothetical protein
MIAKSIIAKQIIARSAFAKPTCATPACATPAVLAAVIAALGAIGSAGAACAIDASAARAVAPVASHASGPSTAEGHASVPSAFGRRNTPLDQVPRPASLVEVLYEATRVLDAGGTALAAIEEAYAEFGAQWRTRLPPKYARLAESDATEYATHDATHDATDDGTEGARGDDAVGRARLRALETAWADADILHAALAERVIASCIEAGIERARDPVAQANFRGRLAHRAAFSDGECVPLERLPILTTPCVDLAIALGHPRVMQRVPAERRATVEALLAAEWPRILSEHQSVRGIGFALAERERRAQRVDGHTAGPIGNAAAIEACASIARLVRANLDANMRFAARIEAEVGVDAADALRVELIANACRDGGFAEGIVEPWRATQRLLRRIREDRALDDAARGSAERAVREERRRFIAECVTAYRSVLADERSFSPGIEVPSGRGVPRDLAFAFGSTGSEELRARFERAAQSSAAESFDARLARLAGVPATAPRDRDDVGDAGPIPHSDVDADRERLFRTNFEHRFLDEGGGDDDGRASGTGSDDDVAADGGGDAEAPRPSASDLRRVGVALWLDGIDRPRHEIEPVLDAFLRSWIASRPEGDSSASAMFARRRVEHAAGARGRDLEAWRELPDVVRCEAEFDDARAKTLAAAFGMPLDAAARTALRLERVGHLLDPREPAFGGFLPDGILATATACGLDRAGQRAFLVELAPAVDALAGALPALADRARDAAASDLAAERALQARAERESGDSEGVMDRVERGGPVLDATDAFEAEMELHICRMLLDALRAIEIDPLVRLRCGLRLVERVTRTGWNGPTSTIRLIGVVREALGDDPERRARLDACERSLLEEALGELPPPDDRARRDAAGDEAGDEAAGDDPHAAAWAAWRDDRWRREAEALAGGASELGPRSSDIEGHRMRLVLEAIDGAANEPRLQRIVAMRYANVLGRLRQTPFADQFHP